MPEGILRFMTKQDFLLARDKGKYTYIDKKFEKLIDSNESKLNDVFGINLSSGSLKVDSGFKLDEKKFIELTRLK